MKTYDIIFVLPMPTTKIVGGYKMVYEYANYISQCGYSVCIVYNAVKGRNSRNLPRLFVYIIRKIIGKYGPSWFELDKNVDKRVIPMFNEKYLPDTKRIVATTAESAIFVNDVQKNVKKYYFIQDFENWSISTDMLYKTYNYDMKKIVVAKWLKKVVDMHSNEESVYIPNGINTDIFKITKKIEQRHSHSVALLYHLDERKGCDVSFKVLDKLKVRYPDLIVNMFGSPEECREWPEWIHYKRNASPKEVSVIMNNSAVFLCTSRMEGYGLTGLESLFCGCVLVSTDCLGVKEYVTEKSALLCEVDNSELLFKHICYAFEDVDIRRQMAIEFEKYKDIFRIENSKEKFYEVVMR